MTGDQPHSGAPGDQVEELYQLRRSTHAFVTQLGAQYWAQYRQLRGRLQVPPLVAALPAARQPEALAITEASRIARADLYLIGEASLVTAVTIGAEIGTISCNAHAEPPRSGLVDVKGIVPPAKYGFLRWASGVSYSAEGAPIIACHWGAVQEGYWLTWWADGQIGATLSARHLGWSQEQVRFYLSRLGPLTFEGATLLETIAGSRRTAAAAPTGGGGSGGAGPITPEAAEDLALLSTVFGSWALLTRAGAAHLTRHTPSQAQRSADLRAGLRPRPATVVTGPAATAAGDVVVVTTP